jgi:hypothetical protein
MDEDLTLVRIAQNQAAFREANEKIELAAERVPLFGPVPFICECADTACTEIVRLDLDEYEEVRTVPQRFVVAPGHEEIAVSAGAGVAVAYRAGYVIVDKVGIAGEVAADEYKKLAE